MKRKQRTTLLNCVLTMLVPGTSGSLVGRALYLYPRFSLTEGPHRILLNGR
jgi:hypothetical protein